MGIVPGALLEEGMGVRWPMETPHQPPSTPKESRGVLGPLVRLGAQLPTLETRATQMQTL